MTAAPQKGPDPAEDDDIGTGPQRRDVLIILACFVVDVFFSGYYEGQPVTTHLGFDLPLWLVLPVILVAYGALAWRRQAPWPVFLFIVGFCVVAGLSLELFEPFAVTGLALYAVARRTPARRANPALVLMAFPSMSNAVTATNLTGDSSIFALIVIGTIFMSFATLLWVLGRRERRSVLRARAEQAALRATAEESLGHERQRIARDLHDILSHSMSAMILQSAGAKAVSSKLDGTDEAKKVTEALSAIETTGAESMRELHRLLGLLRTQDGDDGPGVPRLRLGDISPLIDATRHGGLVVQRHQEGLPRPLDASVDLAAYHLVQESLTNAMKHAGRGAVVDIYETWEPAELQLQVRSAQGLSSEEPEPDLARQPVGSGTGLWGLNERVELAGGHFSSGPVDGGFVTVATFPLRAVSTPGTTSAPATRTPQEGAS
jgi:signal transduction histidine kinase